MKENDKIFGEDFQSIKMSRMLSDDDKIKEANLNSIEDENNLFKFNDKISSDEEEPLISDDDLNKKEHKIKRKIFSYNFKDHLMMIFLLLSSSMNFSIFYIPLIIIGICYILLLLNNNKDYKRIKMKVEIFCLIYSLLLIIFKLVIIGLIDNGNLDSEKEVNKLNNFGIRYSKENKSFLNIIISFIGEGILFIICIYSLFISFLNKKIDMENVDNQTTKEKLFRKLKHIIIICYILLLLLVMYNRSYITYFYLFIYQILLIIITFKNNFPVIYFIFKNIRYFFILILTIQLLLINIFNIYSIQENLLKKYIIHENANDDEIKKVYSIFTKFGIYYSYYNPFLQFIYGYISYFFCVSIIVLLSSCKIIINDYQNIINHKKLKLKEFSKNEDNINDERENKSENDTTFAKITKNKLSKMQFLLIHYFSLPHFIFHFLRILSLLWIFYLRNFYSIGIFIGLFCSFIFNEIKIYRILIIILIIPITILSFGCLHFSNINGNFENLNEEQKQKYLRLGFEKDEKNGLYLLIGIYYLCIILFLNSFTNYYYLKKLKIDSYSKNRLIIESENEEELSNKQVPLLNNEEKKEIKNENNNEINLNDVILKFIYQNIDKITLIAMYFISMHTVNIIHFIFIIIFMIQILQQKIIKKFNKIIIIIIQVLFLFEYIIDLTKNYYPNFFETNINLFVFLVTLSDEKEVNITIEIFCYAAVYTFYIQNQLISSFKYQQLESDENISLKNYINLKFKNFKKVINILFLLFKIVIEIYILFMFFIFFYICCNFEINLLFSIKLAIFFVVIYNFLQKIQIIEKNVNISLKFNSFLIAYSCFNSFIVYAYQLICLKLIGLYDYIQKSENIIIQNLPSIGLINYQNKNLLYKLLPHFLSIFLAILLYNELKSIYDKIENEKNKRNYDLELNFIKDKKIGNQKFIQSNDIINYIENKDNNIIKEYNNESEEKNNSSEITIKAESIKQEENNEIITTNNERIEKNINTNIDDQNDINNIYKQKNKYYTEYIKIKEKVVGLNKKYIIYLLIMFALKLYYPFIFLLICIIFTTYNLSFSLIIFFLIISLNSIFMFVNILNSTYNFNYNYYHPFIMSQLVRYRSIETKKHHTICNIYKYQTFKYLSIFNFIFLFFNYLYSIVYYFKRCNNNLLDNDDNLCDNHDIIIENLSFGKYIKFITYLLGIYKYFDKTELIDSCWLYLIFFLIIYIDIYIQKIIQKLNIKVGKNREEYYDNKYKKFQLKNILYAIKNIKYEKKRDNKEKPLILEELEELIKNYEIIKKNKLTKKRIDKANFESYFLNIFKKSKNNIFVLSKNSKKRKIILFLRIFKKIIEYFIIFVLICGVIIKVNIWSLIYMSIVIYLLLTKKNINKFNKLLIIIIISVIIQSIIFLSNINKEIDPKLDDSIINDISFIPWYNKILGDNYIKHSLILGLGINKNQLSLIWVEYLLIFLIYIYLYYFCYTIYNNKYIELKEWKYDKKSLIYKLLIDEEIRDALLKMKNSHQYQRIYNCMKNNFDIKLDSFSNVIKSIYNFNKINKKRIVNEKRKISKINIYSSIIYLLGHNIIIIIIAIISMMTSGFLSIIYICFCLYFLYTSKSINKGKIYYYPFFIKSVCRPIIILDISFQLIIQIPYIYVKNLSEKGFFKYLCEILGLIRITNENFEITGKIIFLLGKCFCFFCMCFQKIIYSSKSFNEFYLYYLIIKNEKFKCISLINAFRFNNERMKTMNKSIQLKKDMEDLMKNLQKDLIEWNAKLFTNEKSNNININNDKLKINFINNNENISNDNYNDDIKTQNFDMDNNNNESTINKFNNEMTALNLENNNKNNVNDKSTLNLFNISLKEDMIIAKDEIVREVVKKWILRKNFLIKIHLFLNRKGICYHSASNEKELNEYIINTIQGENKYIPLLEKKIDNEILKLDLSVFKNNEISTLKKYLKKLNKINSNKFSKIISFLNNENEVEKEKNKKLNEKFKILIKQEKYKQFSRIKNSKLFQKYLTTSFLLKKIIIDLELILTNNFNWICYFVMILNHILNASIISLFYPLSIFCYALLEYPRPPRKYWNICLLYTFIFLIIKCFMQKDFFGAFLNVNKKGDETTTYYKYLQIFFEHYPIGIKLFDENNKKSYFLYLIIDFLVIFILIINTHILLINGLWENTEKYIENIFEATNRLSMNKDKIFEDEKEIKRFNKFYLLDKINANRYMKRTTTIIKNDKEEYKNMLNLKGKYIEETKNYFQKLLPTFRNEKPGKDFYYIYSLAMILIIFYVLFFYTTMVQDKTYGAFNISTKQFSGTSIILVLVHTIILIFDRVIYLSQNRYNIKYEYSFYDKKKNKLIGENTIEFNEIKENIIKLYPDCNNRDDFKLPFEYIPELNKNYNIIFFQTESFNIPLLEKYILYILLIIFSHGFIFFYITMKGNYNLNNAIYCFKETKGECNNFLENKTIIIFYVIFLIYHIFSGLQIKHGFYDLKRKSIFKNVNSMQGLIFEIYKLIPFYYQIKNVIDWTFTPTSLDLFDWFKFENIYDEIFKTYRLKNPYEKKPIGKRIKKIIKLIIGGLTSFILILILVLPLILFSSLNPTNEINNITEAQMTVYLSFLDNNQQEKNYLIFENYWPEGIYNISDEIWYDFGYYNSFYTKTFPKKQIQIVSFYSEPENPLSEFKLSHIVSSIESLLNITNSSIALNQMTINKEIFTKCNLIIQVQFSRPLPNEAKIVTKKTKLLICDYEKDKEGEGCKGLNQLYNFFNNEDYDNNDEELKINIYGFSPYVRLTANSEPKEDDLQLNKKLILKPSYRNKAYIFDIYFDYKINEGIQYHVFNDKVSSSTFGYSIIGFYSAFILVIGTYVTNFFNYNPEKIIIGEMPHPEKLLNLCECVKISRYTYDFKKEEYLFNILIEILRTPDFIKKLTQSTVEQFHRRTYLPS